MTVMRTAFASAVLAVSVGANAAAADESHHAELTALSIGSFTTLDHAKRDDRYGVAEAEIVRIWPARKDGVWFYQEQALLGYDAADLDPAMKDRPYFARVIHSREVEPGVVKRTVHKLKSPDEARGAWRREAPLENLSAADLEDSECEITVQRVAENFWRSESERCPNAYKGASYALSFGVVTKNEYANWDRGFTDDGRHVWGPASGGYIFKRKQ